MNQHEIGKLSNGTDAVFLAARLFLQKDNLWKNTKICHRALQITSETSQQIINFAS